MVLVATLAMGIAMTNETRAYVANGPTWAQRPVSYFINTTNLDLSEDAVEAAVRAGADTWHAQSNASFSFAFAGRSTLTTTTYDALNLVVFRNASSGSAIATTYWWSNGSGIVDADIVFWDAGFQFFSGSTGCSGGFYIEDIAAHEFGHALGLGHSTSTNATMYPTVASCDKGNRTLDADDIAGVVALYPPSSTAPRAPTGLRVVGG
jgi:hypothetical protein